MNLKDAYNLLCLPENATREQVEERYNEFSETFSSSASIEEFKHSAEIKQAYHIVVKYLEEKRIKEEKQARFALQRKEIVGKLKSAISLHGLQAFTAAAAVTGVLISVSTFKDLFGLVLNSVNLESPSVLEVLDPEGTSSPTANPKLEDAIAFSEPAIDATDIFDLNQDYSVPTTEKGYTIEMRNGITYVDGYLIVNKSYSLPSDYVPSDPYVPITGSNGADFLDRETMEAFKVMKSDAAMQGINLWIASGFRSYSYQESLYNKYVGQSSAPVADTYSARPGYSEHQTGLAFDLNSVNQSFANTREGFWVNQNCYKYGFIIRYPKGKDAETGYMYEPWHLRYVGVELATELYNGGDWITMESHFGITSDYNYEKGQEQGFTK